MANLGPGRKELRLKMGPSSYQSSEAMDDEEPVEIRHRSISPSPVVLPLIRVGEVFVSPPNMVC